MRLGNKLLPLSVITKINLKYMLSDKDINNDFFEAGKSKGTRVIVHRKFKSNVYVARLDGTSDTYISESPSLNDVIKAARDFMGRNDIFALTIHEPNGKIRRIEETSVKRLLRSTVKRKISRMERMQKLILTHKKVRRYSNAIKPLYNRYIVRDEIIN